MLNLLVAASDKFFYENWIIVKQLIWAFGKCMSGIMWLLDQIGIYNIALCIVLFTLITKVILLPFTIKQQKTTKLNAFIAPELSAIQKKYKDKKDQASQQKMMMEQNAVREKYGISMGAGCLTSIIQLPILFALYPVIYRMEEYVDYLSVLKDKLSAEQIDAMYRLLSINLSEAPGYKLALPIIIPILTAASQFLSTKIMTKSQETPDASDNPMASSMKGMTYVMPLMMGVVAVSLPGFLGIYWIVQSLLAALQQVLINKQLDKVPMEEMIQKNIEQANKKRAKKGMPLLNEKAAINTRNIDAEAKFAEAETKNNGLSDEEKAERMRKATEYYQSRSAAPGSLAAKANMVRDFNEKNKN